MKEKVNKQKKEIIDRPLAEKVVVSDGVRTVELCSSSSPVYELTGAALSILKDDLKIVNGNKSRSYIG